MVLKRRLKIAALMCLAPIAFIVFFLLVERVRGGLALRLFKWRLASQGLTLSPKDFGSRDPAGADAAKQLWVAVSELKEGGLLPNDYPPRMKMTEAGRAVIGFQQGKWPDKNETNLWEQLAEDLQTNQSTLDRIKVLLEKPVINNQLDYAAGPMIRFTHLTHAKQLTFWFGSQVALGLHSDRNHDSLEPLIAEIGLPRALETDNLLISELVRIAISAISRNDTWEAMQANDWKDNDLARIQNAWAANTFATNLLRSLEGELVFEAVTCERMRKSNDDTYSFLFGMQDFMGGTDKPAWEQFVNSLPEGERIASFLKQQVYCRVWRFAWVDQYELHHLKRTGEFLRICQRAISQKSLAAASENLNAFTLGDMHSRFYDRLRFPDFESLITFERSFERSMQAETERSVILCVLAERRYHLKFGRHPERLDMLVPDFLLAVPTDYMDGQPVKYHLKPDGSVVIYSSGLDGHDDSGDAELNSGGVNVRDLWYRKDFVWPAPATEEEVAIYRKKPW